MNLKLLSYCYDVDNEDKEHFQLKEQLEMITELGTGG